MELKKIAKMLTDVRMELISKYPFFGRLLMHLPISFKECGTACTDMRRIYFDPAFAERIGEGGVRFVLLHEVMHCVLKHCTRGKGKIGIVYNIACDIVVNSLLLETLDLKTIKIDGAEVMHLAPDGREGRAYTAEEVYDMLLCGDLEALCDLIGSLDCHDTWSDCHGSFIEDEWDSNIKSAARAAGVGSGIPEGLRRYVDIIQRESKISWRQLLCDFIKSDRADFDFTHPDRRFTNDAILPSFMENMYGEAIEDIWFVADTSASVSREMLSQVMAEIRGAVDQIDRLCGKLSFFDYQVTEPVDFETVEELERIPVLGGGGTSFENVFKSMPALFPDALPAAVVILTDGYDNFPDEELALGVPVLWIITDQRIEPPWGQCVYI